MQVRIKHRQQMQLEKVKLQEKMPNTNLAMQPDIKNLPQVMQISTKKYDMIPHLHNTLLTRFYWVKLTIE